jgi:dTDP-L-rhamnose 4-epimerase
VKDWRDKMQTSAKIAIITGGIGFIGTNLIDQIWDKYQKLIIVDSISTRVHGNDFKFRCAKSNVVLVEGLVQDDATWRRVEEAFPEYPFEIDVVHLASNTSTADSFLNPSEHVETNVLGTAVMCEFLQGHLDRLNLILLTSTRAVYGEGTWLDSEGSKRNPNLRVKSNLEQAIWNPFFEDEECDSLQGTSTISCNPNPSNVYGLTKLAQENLIKVWSETNGISYCVLRLQNVYGPGQSLWNSYSGVVSLFIKQSLLSESIQVYEEGGIIRDFIFVDDVTAIIIQSLNNPGSFKIIDVGTGIPVSLLEVANLISIKTSSPRPIITKKYRIGDVRGIYADNSQLREVLPEFEFTKLDKGIDMLLAWAVDEIEKNVK